MYRRVSGQTAPAAADLQHPFARFQFQLTADHVEFVVLRLLQVVGFRPISARVAHTGIEHGFEHVVADVVMSLADLEGAGEGLQVE